MGVILVVALAVGARARPGAATVDQRVRRITSEIRCPTCRSQSVADSDAPAAVFIRDDVRARVQSGQSDGAVRDYLVSRYGKDIQLRPDATGVSGLVWFLPALGVVCAVGGLAFAFRRWRARPGPAVSEADRARVEQAMRS